MFTPYRCGLRCRALEVHSGSKLGVKLYRLGASLCIHTALFTNNLSWYSDGLDGRGIGFRFLAGKKGFSLLHSVQSRSETQPPSNTVGTLALSLWFRRLDRQADHSPQYRAELRTMELHINSPVYLNCLVLVLN
jgi:hypothetical protein